MNYFLKMLMKQQRTMMNQMCKNFHHMMMLMLSMLGSLMMLMPI